MKLISKIGMFLFLSVWAMTAQGEINFKAHNLPRKFDYGVRLVKEGRNYYAYVWKDDKEKFIKKKIFKSLYTSIENEFKRFRYEALVEKHKGPSLGKKGIDPDGIVEFEIETGGKKHSVKVNRFQTSFSYLENRIIQWVNYYNARLVTPNINKLKKLK